MDFTNADISNANRLRDDKTLFQRCATYPSLGGGTHFHITWPDGSSPYNDHFGVEQRVTIVKCADVMCNPERSSGAGKSDEHAFSMSHHAQRLINTYEVYIAEHGKIETLVAWGKGYEAGFEDGEEDRVEA